MQKEGLTKAIVYLGIALGLTILIGCEVLEPETGPIRKNARQRAYNVYPMIENSFAVGDSVEALAGTLIYKSSSGTGNGRSITEGTEGEITNGPENGFWEVLFSGQGRAGWTLESNLALIGTTPPDTTPPPPPPPDTTASPIVMMGGIGCSKTRDWFQALDIYAPDIPHWPQYDSNGGKVMKGLSGGGYSKLSNPNDNRWNHFDRGLAEHPETDAIMHEGCVSDIYVAGWWTPGMDVDPSHIDMGISIANTLASKAPNATLYSVGTWPYVDGHTPQGDEYHDEYAQALSDTLIAMGYFQAPTGFERRKLEASELKDGKHVNSLGMQKQAEDTEDWFDYLSNQ